MDKFSISPFLHPSTDHMTVIWTESLMK